MGLFGRQKAQLSERSRLQFASTAALERALDGTDEWYERYYFALYHCSPDEPAGINERRAELRCLFPEKAIAIGRHFVLSGEPAFLALSAHYQALVKAETLPEEYRAHAQRRHDAISEMHRKSQNLSVDLTEGQLSNDPELDFYACMALLNGQIVFDLDK